MTTRDDDLWAGENVIPFEESKRTTAIQKKSEAWLTALEWSKGSRQSPPRPLRTLRNTMLALRHCPAWKGLLRKNNFSGRIELTRDVPQATGGATGDGSKVWNDDLLAPAIAWCQEHIGWEPTTHWMQMAVVAAAGETSYHPVRDYLEALRWDGVLRLDTLLQRLFGAQDTPFIRAVGCKWMISAVARITRPGCQVDHMIVLEGAQGIRKSTALRTLVGEAWFRNTPLDLRDKDAYMALRGCWVYEFDELDSLRGRDLSKVKSFITGRVDSYRVPYKSSTDDVPRECVFAGSTNEEQYLSDPTGNRRFWPVLCGAINVQGIAAERDQLWAEARARFESDESWWIADPELEAEAQEQQSERVGADPWLSTIAERYEALLPSRKAEGVTSEYVLTDWLDVKMGSIKRPDEGRVGHLLRQIGLDRRRVMVAGVKKYRYFPKNMQGALPVLLR